MRRLAAARRSPAQWGDLRLRQLRVAHVYHPLGRGGLNGTTFKTSATSNLPAGFTANLSYTNSDVILNLTGTLWGERGARRVERQPAERRQCTQQLLQQRRSAAARICERLGPSPAPTWATRSLPSPAKPRPAAQKVGFQLTNQFLNLMLDPFVDGRSGVGGADHPALGFAPERETVPPDIAHAYASVLKAPPKAAADL